MPRQARHGVEGKIGESFLPQRGCTDSRGDCFASAGARNDMGGVCLDSPAGLVVVGPFRAIIRLFSFLSRKDSP